MRIAYDIPTRSIKRPSGLDVLRLGTFMHVTYKTCHGGNPPTPRDFKCTVTDASDDHGNVVDSGAVSCAVTVP